jgi:predicted outer membrane protein
MTDQTDLSPVSDDFRTDRPLLVGSLLVVVLAVIGGMLFVPASASASVAAAPASVPAAPPAQPQAEEPYPPRPAPDVARSVPLTATDKLFLVKVRQAGLWEMPTGQQAQTRASSARVKEVGLHLFSDHTLLDAQVRSIASELGVDLPSTPSALQQGWMAELSKVQGPAYDKLFADRLRAAHGTVFAIVAQIRAGTRNPLIRAFAQRAIVVVMRHMTLLESIGLVNYNALPQPAVASTPAAVATPVAATRRLMPSGQTGLIVGMLGAAALIGTISMRRARRGR